MSEPLLIRRLGVADAAAYQQLRLKALELDGAAFLASLEREKQKGQFEFGQELEYARSSGYLGYYGAHLADQLVGYCHVSQSFLPKQDHVLFLYNLYVSRTARGKHIGQTLLAHVFEIGKSNGAELVYASCNSSNATALAFYARVGFVECGRKPRSVKWDGQYDDEVELVKEL